MDLQHIPIYDHHAHALFHENVWRTAPLEPYFTEAYDPEQLPFTRDNLYFRRSMRDLAEFYGCEATVEAVLEARQTWDYLELCRTMFAKANLSHWLVDDGIWTDRLWSVGECAERLPPKVHRVARLETELATFVPNYDSAAQLFDAFATHLHQLAPSLAAFKSIIAYRTGLKISRHHSSALERAYTDLKRDLKPGQVPRINTQPILDEALWVALEIAAQSGKPVQFHTGYGDPDLDMRLANPLHLRSVFEAKELKGLKVVMLHCYPFIKETGFLASVYSGAYLDVGLTIPYTSVHGMKTSLHEALHLSPIKKVLFSTDAQRTPEIFYLAAKWGRKVLGEVLDETIANGDLTTSEATWAAERILQQNSAELYKVG